MVSQNSQYKKLGVDPEKRGTDAFKKVLTRVDFSLAFCDIYSDPDNPDSKIVLHTDGAGSKPIQAYIHWKETGDWKVFEGLAQDVVMMNLGDVDCVGAKPLMFNDYVAINPFNLPKKEVLASLSKGFKRVFSLLKKYGTDIIFAGGETADLPDQLRTLDISGTIYARGKVTELITGEKIKKGDVIIGLRSGGKTKFEEKSNSGIMCNGITLARKCLMSEEYNQLYPETYDPRRPYSGRFRSSEYHPDLGTSVGEAILSPTRMFSIPLKEILEKYGPKIHGMVFNTGGGQTKCLRIGKQNLAFVKDNLPEPDPIFWLIQQESGESWEHMYEDFNMGIGMELYVPPGLEKPILEICKSYGMDAQRIGYIEESETKSLIIKSEFGEFKWTK